MRKLISPVTILGVFAVILVFATTAFASHTTPGGAGRTKVNIYDDTHNVWNVVTTDPDTGMPDADIGFVNFRPTVVCPPDTECNPNHIILVASLKKAAPNCTLTVELVTSGNDPEAGLAPDSFHTGVPNVVGSLTTNKQGNGTTGAIVVDVSALANVAPAGSITYAHVDLEDHTGTCQEADGTPVSFNEYGASGQPPVGPELGLPTNIHWVQP